MSFKQRPVRETQLFVTWWWHRLPESKLEVALNAWIVTTLFIGMVTGKVSGQGFATAIVLTQATHGMTWAYIYSKIRNAEQATREAEEELDKWQ